MFRKLLNVGKGHSNDKLQQQQAQQRNLFQLNEIRSYGFSHLCCLGYSASLSLLAVGSKYGLLRVLGNSSVEFSHQLSSSNAIRQIEFIDCRQAKSESGASANIVVLTDNGQLHLFELKTVKKQNFADNTTQTEAPSSDCCQLQQQQREENENSDKSQQVTAEYTKLQLVGQLDYFIHAADDEDRSKRVTTFEVSHDSQQVLVGTEGGNLYLVPLSKFEPLKSSEQVQEAVLGDAQASSEQTPVENNKQQPKPDTTTDEAQQAASKDDETTAVNLSDEPLIVEDVEPFETVKFEEHLAEHLDGELKAKKPGAVESIKRHPSSNGLFLVSFHRGLSIILNVASKSIDKYFYHSQAIESSCFADQTGNSFYTSHNDGSYTRWDAKQASQTKANKDLIGQLYGPYPCKPAPKIQACTGLVNDQLEDLLVFSGGMPKATYDDKNPVTIVRASSDGKDSIKTVLDFTSKVLDFALITRPRGNLGAGAKSTGGGGKKNKHKQQQQQQQQRDKPIAVALAILAEEEFVVIDLLNSESYLEFALPYLNCVHSSAITCNQHYSDVSDELYEQLLAYNKQLLKGKQSANEWPITGGKVIDAPEVKSHDILLTGHEDGSVHFWDVSDLSMRHLLNLSTSRFFSTVDDDLVPIEPLTSETNKQSNEEQDASSNQLNNNHNDDDDKQDNANQQSWKMKRVGRFDPFSDDTRLAVRKVSLCPKSGTLVVAGTGGQVLVFELRNEASELESLTADEITIVSDNRFTWKGRDKLSVRQTSHKFDVGYQLASYVQLSPPVSASSLDLRTDWNLYALGTSYGFILYDYANKHLVVNRCTLNVQDFSIVSGDNPGLGAMSRKKSFRKSLRESFKRLRRGRSQRNQQAANEQPPVKPSFGRVTTGVRTLSATPSGGDSSNNVHRNVYSTERQVEPKVELSSIVKCITLTSAIITNNASFSPTLWVGTNSGQVLVYSISLATDKDATNVESAAEQTDENPASDKQLTTAKLAKEIQLKHKAPIIAIFTSPEPTQQQQQQPSQVAQLDASLASESVKSSPEKQPLQEVSAESAENKSQPETQNESSERAASPAVAAIDKLSPSKKDKELIQPRVLICSEEQFKVFNLPNLKPFCKFKLTAHEGLRAKKISITQFLKPNSNKSQLTASAPTVASSGQLSSSKSLQSFATQTSPPSSPVPPAEAASAAAEPVGDSSEAAKNSESNNNSLSTLNNNHTKQDSKDLMNAKFGAKSSSMSPVEVAKSEQVANEESQFEPYMVCMSNQGDCAIYSVPDLKRQAQIQVCKREDINGITSAMLTNYGEGYYLKSSSNFLRFSISTQRVLRVLSVV